jgi:hypothetical protein
LFLFSGYTFVSLLSESVMIEPEAAVLIGLLDGSMGAAIFADRVKNLRENGKLLYRGIANYSLCR